MKRSRWPVRATHSASRRLPTVEVRVAEVADLALVHEIVKRRQRLFNLACRIGPVHLVQIDPVGAQPAQRVLDGTPDVAA